MHHRVGDADADRHAVTGVNDWECWVCWDYGNDGGPSVTAVFPTELEALQHAQNAGYYMKVKRMESGDVLDQLRSP